jgi:hypothetical protein
MQPVLNIPRQLIRDGRGGEAHAILCRLHHAALTRTGTAIDGMNIDFATLTSTPGAHREARTLTWTALLADGTRALAAAGRWEQAARHATAHRGTGSRLLDGRQAAILALLTSGHAGEAAPLAEQSTASEPWEHAVRAVLGVLCAGNQAPRASITTMLDAACELARENDPPTAADRARTGLAALELSIGSCPALLCALVAMGSADGYAARDLLASTKAAAALTSPQRTRLLDLVSACGLGAGPLPRDLRTRMAAAVSQACTALGEGGSSVN